MSMTLFQAVRLILINFVMVLGLKNPTTASGAIFPTPHLKDLLHDNQRESH
jgi:hypothetical protein